MTALIETVRVRGGRAPLWPLHLRRLARSCAALGIPFPHGLVEPAGGRDRVHRLEVDQAGVRVSERELPADASLALVTVATIHPGYPHKTTEREAFVRADAEATARTTGQRSDAEATARTAGDRADAEAATRRGGEGTDGEATAGWSAAALLLTPDGLVAEGSIWCLFWWEGGRVAAPALDLGILEGVSRVRIGELAGTVLERRLVPGDLRGRSIFLANAVRGIVQPATFEGIPVPANPLTARLRETFWP